MTDEADLAGMRRRYERGRLLEGDLAADPFEQFQRWLADAVRAEVVEPNAMVLATVDERGVPSTRHVLLKELDDTGFVFFTNHTSRKAREMAANPAVAITVGWLALERQVGVRGRVEQVPAEETTGYWVQRPRESQLGAWASHQSAPVASRDALEAQLREQEQRFPGDVPVPSFWGGYRVVPDAVEFWQGGPGRLHDRVLMTRSEHGPGWERQRLSP